MNKRFGLFKVLGVIAAGVMVITASCAQVTTENITGLLQAMQGKEMVVTLADGSTVRITVQDARAAAAAQQLVGRQVDVRIRVRGQERDLDNVRRIGEDQKFTGVIQAMGSDNWTIGGRVFKVNANTKLDGGLALGVTARVEFVTQPDGSLLATEIETDEEDEKFSGAIQSIGADAWVIGGQTFKVNAATRIDQGLAVGMPARAEFVIQPDGSFLAIEIESERQEDRFAGVIQAIGTDNWTIGGRVFNVNAATRLDEGLAVGVKARVEFITLADGSLLATEIETDEAENRFSGVAENIAAGAWVVSGQTFKVTAATRIDPGLVVGSRVKVRFTTSADGSMLATRIQEDRSGTSRQDDFSGIVESIDANTLMVGGQTFKLSAATRKDAGVAVGAKVRVRFTTLADGSKLATQVQIDRSGRGAGEGEAEREREREVGSFVAHLSGSEEAPPVNTQGQGEAIFRLSDDGAVLTFRLNIANTENITMAHIHIAAKGQVGPVAVWLYPSAPPAVLIPGKFDGVLNTGNITAANLVGPLQGQTLNALIARIRGGEAYVNVHTQKFPGGELRGQIGRGSGEGSGGGTGGGTGRQLGQEDQKFTGRIESMGTGSWVIGGRTFVVNTSTVLDSGLAVGVSVTVEFVTQADGSMVAKEIETSR